MFRRWSDVALMLLVLGGIVVGGCTKRPAMAVATAPAPVGIAGSSGPGPAATAVPTARATPGALGEPGAPGAPGVASGSRSQPGTVSGRPPVKDFTVASDLADVYFEFDAYEIRPADERVLESNARWLKSNRDLVLIEGHCDERGTNEYNLALAERRAQSAMSYLVSRGVAASRITIVSYGEERPQCTERNEACWSKNRRAHFLVKPQ